MEANTQAAAGSAGRELRLTRQLNAPRELVFAAWTDPAQLAQWWGAWGFTAPVCELDPRPGGAIRIEMRGPDGTVYPMGGEVRELDPPRRLVFTATALPLGKGKWGLQCLNTLTLEEADGGTLLSLVVEVLEAAPGAAPALAGMEQGWGETLDRLADVVDAGPAPREFVVSRVVAAPRELVWEVYTNPTHADKWWGPNGFTNTTLEHDFRVGGTWRHIMHGPDGKDYPNRKLYLEIEAPARIVNTHGWDDDRQAPLFIATITFEEVAANQTKVTMRARFTSAEIRERIAVEFGAIDGANQTLNRLAEYVTQVTFTPGGGH